MNVRFLTGVAAAVAVAGLLAPSGASAAEPGNHNGVGSLEQAAGGPPRDTSPLGAINFDLGTAPCNFAETGPLGHEYHESHGVEFRGPSDGQGGAILNECGSFGVDARSGEEFLAFASGSYAVTPEHILFDDPQRKVTLYAANGWGDGTSVYKLKAYRNDRVVARKTVSTTEIGWVKLKVADRRGFDEVVLEGSAPDGAFIVDDLNYQPK